MDQTPAAQVEFFPSATRASAIDDRIMRTLSDKAGDAPVPQPSHHARVGTHVDFWIRDKPEDGARSGTVTRVTSSEIYVSNVDNPDLAPDDRIFGQWIDRASFTDDPDVTFEARVVG